MIRDEILERGLLRLGCFVMRVVHKYMLVVVTTYSYHGKSSALWNSDAQKEERRTANPKSLERKRSSGWIF